MPTQHAKARPAFIVGTETGRQPEVETGLTWLLSTASGDEEALVVAASKSQFEMGDLADALGEAARVLARGGVVTVVGGPRLHGATARTYPPRSGWQRGPVLAVWPDEALLATIDGDFRVTALGVVPWLFEEVATWARGRSAVDLKTGKGQAAPKVSDPVVEAALRDVTIRVNLGSGLVHPSDKAAAVEAFRILKDGGHRWARDEVEAWAIANRWSVEYASDLGDVSERVQEGRRFQVPRGRSWTPRILDMWRQAA